MKCAECAKVHTSWTTWQCNMDMWTCWYCVQTHHCCSNSKSIQQN